MNPWQRAEHGFFPRQISDGLLKLGFPEGGFLEGLQMYSPDFQGSKTRVVGPAFTVKFAPKSDSTASKVVGNYIDRVTEDAVIFISQPLPHVTACFGGLMSLRAKHLGAKGVIIDGSVRDLQEHRDAGFPVFARGQSTSAANLVCFASELNIPVTVQSAVQEVTVNPNDYIIADLDGVVCLPAALVEQVLEKVAVIADANDKCAEAIRGGMTVEEAFAKYREKK
ncbi:Fc.00g086890.m01.CDS01 [Cosmosporella sp. VM-42]